MLSSPPHGTRPFPAGAWAVHPATTTITVSVSSWLIGRVRLTLNLVEGHVEVDERGTIRRMSVTLASASVDSGKARRDEYLRSPDFLDADRSPFVTYSGRSCLDVIDGVVQVKDHNAALRLKATEATVNDDGTATFAAHGVIDRRLLGLGKLSAILIGNQLDVELRGTARAAY